MGSSTGILSFFYYEIFGFYIVIGTTVSVLSLHTRILTMYAGESFSLGFCFFCRVADQRISVNLSSIFDPGFLLRDWEIKITYPLLHVWKTCCDTSKSFGVSTLLISSDCTSCTYSYMERASPPSEFHSSASGRSSVIWFPSVRL